MPQNKESLQLTLSLDKHEFAPSDDIYCRVELKNIGRKDFTVNKRLAVNYHEARKHLKEIHFAICDASGKYAEFTAKIRIGSPKMSDYVTLAPGESIYKLYPLKLYYRLQSGTEYTIQAVCQQPRY